MELFPFQLEASSQIAERFRKYMEDPLAVTRTKLVPFYQNLSAITGSGKTLILADTVEQIRVSLPVEPIVLWLSKGKVVVWQTYANLSTGKYAALLGGYEVEPLLEAKPADVEDSTRGLVLVATVAKFNQKDREQGDRRIFRVELDTADESLWDLLKNRKDSKGIRRPLIVVYDEGHNLSNQQTKLLMDLAPDALIAASATTRVPEELSRIIERLRQDKGWTDDDFVTAVRSAEVVSSGLVKKHIMLGGYLTPMETAIDDMLVDMSKAETASSSLGLSYRPKAIYVSTTNAADGVPIKEDVGRPFKQRMARPILIWRYLVEKKKIDPTTIAVYCNLKFDPKLPPPKNFNLFSGGDADYDRFKQGNYRHVIFNLSLQEGWDDPECCFAYIDKDMGSPDQVTQIVGRVLRQPGATHYPPPVLNTAHFYIRTDEKGVFEAVLRDVRTRISSDLPDISITVRKGGPGGTRSERKSLKERTVPTAAVDSAQAIEPIKGLIQRMHDYRRDPDNTIGKGVRVQVLQTIGTEDGGYTEWVEVEHSNRVTARWVMRREVQRLFPANDHRRGNPVNLCDIEDPRFDAFVEYNSPAADHIRELAAKVVAEYIKHSVILQFASDHPYQIDSVPVDESKLVRFTNSLHEGYSDLNGLELRFANALDRTKRIWCRNPAQGGYGIPLLSGKTKTFYPDFLIWADKKIYAIDTKGDHLLLEDANRKLFHIEQVEEGDELVIRLVSEGKWSAPDDKVSDDGLTVWLLKHGKVEPIYCPSEAEAVRVALSSHTSSTLGVSINAVQLV